MLPLVADDGTTLEHLVDVLGPSVLRVLTSPGLHRVVVRDVVIYDVADPPTLGGGDVLLGVGLVPNSDSASRVVREAGEAGAAAVVVRSREADLPNLRRAAIDNDMTLMVLSAREMEPVIRAEPGVALAMLKAMAGRLRTASSSPTG